MHQRDPLEDSSTGTGDGVGNNDRWRHSSSVEFCCFGKCKKKGNCCCHMRSKFDCAMCTFITIALIAMFFAVFIPVVVNNLVDELVNEQLIIDSKDAPSYDTWQSNTDPDSKTIITYKLYFFDIQNPKEIIKGEVPYVTELGPYSFREYFYNFDVEWTDDGDTVQLNNQRFYIFDPENTVPGLSLNDSITLSYPTVLGFEWLVDQIPINATILLNYLIEAKLYDAYGTLETDLDNVQTKIDDSGKNIIVRRKLTNEVNNLKFQVDKFYTGLAAFVDESDPADLTVKTILCTLPEIGVSPFWKTNPVSAYFGWLSDPILLEVLQVIKKIEADYNTTIPWSIAVPGVATNYSTTAETKRRKGPSKFKTGKKNIREVNKYVTYQNETSMWICVSPMNSQNLSTYIPGAEFPACEISQYDWNATVYAEKGYRQPFATPYANRVEGSDGNLVSKPVVTDTLQLFIGDIYRSAYIKFREETNDWYDVKLMRYGIQLKDMLNVSRNPNNEQYYSFGPSGMLNLTLAASAPSFATFPHFLYGDSSLVAAVRGLNPDPAVHDSFLDYEPQTGLLTRAKKRLQLAYYHNNTYFPNMPETFGTEADGICTNFTELITVLIDNNITVDYIPKCNASKERDLLTCLSEPQDWIFNNGGVYMPYAWVEEGIDGSADDANDLKDSLYFIEDLANDIEKYSLFVAGFCLLGILTMLFTRDYLLAADLSSGKYYDGDFDDDRKEPLLGVNHYNSKFENSDLR